MKKRIVIPYCGPIAASYLLIANEMQSRLEMVEYMQSLTNRWWFQKNNWDQWKTIKTERRTPWSVGGF